MMEQIKHTAHALGALFYYGPLAKETEGIIQSIHTGDIGRILPDMDIQLWQASLSEANLSTLPQVWQTLFIGPHRFVAPPWGSVYLDSENVIFGESLLALRAFLLQHGLLFDNLHNEAEDHIGLLLLLLAKMIDTHPESVPLFLEEHVLPWAPRYLDCLRKGSQHPFIQVLGSYTAFAFKHWETTLNLTIHEKELFWA